MALLTKEQLEALLGRPLTTSENTNYEQYIDIAEKRLSNILCFSLGEQGEGAQPSARTFGTRKGYTTAYVDPFTTPTVVKLDGEIVSADHWTKKQNDDYQGDWYNVIEFEEPLDGQLIEVTATWGFASLPADLAPLLAGLFGLQETELRRQGVKRKEIEDYHVEYGENSAFDDLVNSQFATIRKYAQCERAVLHGRVGPIYYY